MNKLMQIVTEADRLEPQILGLKTAPTHILKEWVGLVSRSRGNYRELCWSNSYLLYVGHHSKWALKQLNEEIAYREGMLM